MRQKSRLSGVIPLIAVVLFLVSPLQTHAIPLTNTGITAGDFATFAGAAVVPPILTSFDFAPLTVGGDGNVASQVFTGIGPAAGFFVYVYDILHFAASSEVEVGGMSFDFGFVIPPPAVAIPGLGAVTSFIIDGTGTGAAPALPPPPGAPFLGVPPVGTTFADWTLGTLSFGGSPPVPWIAPGAYSGVFGTFSPLPPYIVIADVLDTGLTLASASVYSSAPEPATLLLLGSGLAGLGVVGRKKLFSGKK